MHRAGCVHLRVVGSALMLFSEEENVSPKSHVFKL